MSKNTRNTPADFWRNVDTSGECWNWQAHTTRDGYGHIRMDGKLWIASRLAYHLTYGPIPAGMNVLHRCDNPRCVRPDHLFLGTQKDNVHDMERKGRGRHLSGEDVAHSKLNLGQVQEIRSRHADGVTHRRLAREYGVTEAAIRAVVRRRTWKS